MQSPSDELSSRTQRRALDTANAPYLQTRDVIRNTRRRAASSYPQGEERETQRARLSNMFSGGSAQLSSTRSVDNVEQATDATRQPNMSRFNNRVTDSTSRTSHLSEGNGARSNNILQAAQRENLPSLNHSTQFGDRFDSRQGGSFNAETENSESTENLVMRRALWRRIISRPTLQSSRRTSTASDSQADLDPEDYVFYPQIYRRSAWNPNRGRRRFRSDREDNREYFERVTRSYSEQQKFSELPNIPEWNR
eukprot:jgi/Galph1/5549/GphlegSOOS_G4149.1